MESLDTGLIVAIAASLVAWGLVSARLERLNVSAPMAFVALGVVLANDPLSVIEVNVHGETLRSLAEVTLALLLFSDAARVNLRVLRHDRGVPSRLLLVGLPLTIALGAVLAIVLFPDLSPWAAAAIAAAVAPTDAALGAQVVDDTHVPERIRRVLNVESGLNDGIATPFVTFFIAGTVVDTVVQSSTSLGGALADLAIGVLVGAAVGLGGGLLLKLSTTRGWASPTYRGIAVVALALMAYALAIELSGNGFIGAFVGGIAFGTVVHDPKEREVTLGFDSQTGELLSLVVWFLFGVVVVTALDAATWQTAVFVLLALTVARMLPVALALLGEGFTRTTIAFMGWFGPRGMASVVFAVIAYDSMTGPDARVVLAAITLTVLVSVVAHGFTAAPLSRRYGEHVAALSADAPERQDVPNLASRPQTIPRHTGTTPLRGASKAAHPSQSS
ncbi:MAG: cation:proton antiporter [Ilumatobacteraceae bacterium]